MGFCIYLLHYLPVIWWALFTSLWERRIMKKYVRSKFGGFWLELPVSFKDAKFWIHFSVNLDDRLTRAMVFIATISLQTNQISPHYGLRLGLAGKFWHLYPPQRYTPWNANLLSLSFKGLLNLLAQFNNGRLKICHLQSPGSFKKGAPLLITTWSVAIQFLSSLLIRYWCIW